MPQPYYFDVFQTARIADMFSEKVQSLIAARKNGDSAYDVVLEQIDSIDTTLSHTPPSTYATAKWSTLHLMRTFYSKMLGHVAQKSLEELTCVEDALRSAGIAAANEIATELESTAEPVDPDVASNVTRLSDYCTRVTGGHARQS